MTIPGSIMPLLLRSAAPTEYQISRSVRFNSSDSGYCSRTFTSAGNRKTWTWAAWVKKSRVADEKLFAGGTSIGATTFLQIFFGSTGTLRVSSGTADWVETAQVFRDFSGWYHFVVALDTTQSTGSNRLKLYVNGSEITTFTTDNRAANISQNTDYGININAAHHIGSYQGSSAFFSGYLADIHFIDGQALTPSSFTEVSATTGQLIPKAYTGTFGTNGFWLKFSDNSAATATTLGKDYSGNSNNWTPNNLSVTAGAGNDSLVDTPTSYGTDTGAGGEVRGNYCTLNPLDSGGGTLSNGNLEHTYSSSNTRIRSTISIPETGKWYAEFVASNTGGGNSLVGVSKGTNALTGTNWYLGSDADSWGCQIGSGTMYTYHAGGYSSFGTAASGDVIAVAVDRAAGKIWWAVNNTWIGSGDPSNGTNARYTDIPATGALFFAISNQNSSSIVCNFGQRPFAYTAPSGFKALCDTNLPAPVVAQPSTVMDVKLYTGTGTTNNITGLGFSPDLVWCKVRGIDSSHNLWDSVRGARIQLQSNTTNAEYTESPGYGLTAFNSDGFTLGQDNQGPGRVNSSGEAFVAWTWDAGSSTVTNTQGSITSSVRANPSAGFSIVTFTGPASAGFGSVGHGLNSKPKFILCKDRSNARNWSVYHESVVTTDYKAFILNSTSAVFDSGTPTWDISEINSTIFTPYFRDDFGASYNANNVAYCFSPVDGYSSFGSYVGNGSATSGPFVYTGFRPRFLLVKNSNNTDGWSMWDAARDPYNEVIYKIEPNSSGAEGSNAVHKFDFLSNGFRVRGDWAGINGSGNTIIFACFAESPFQYARAR